MRPVTDRRFLLERLRSRTVRTAAGILLTLLFACGDWVTDTVGLTFPPEISAALQAALDAKVHELGTPGAVALIIQDGDTRWIGETGVGEASNLDSVEEDGWEGDPIDRWSHFRVGSITKTFTATIILQLADEGLLSLDDVIDDHLPGLTPNSDTILIRQLLNMTSGLVDYLYYVPDLYGGTPDVYTPLELIQLAVEKGGTVFDPGGQWGYSNTNYIVLGLIAEHLTGDSFSDLVRTRITLPLGLVDTGVPEPTSTTLPTPHVHGYYNDIDWVDVTGINVSWAWAAGGIISTLEDLHIWINSFIGGKLISPELLTALHTYIETGDDELQYGLGISQLVLPEGIARGHSGALPGYETAAYRIYDYTIIVASNGNVPLKALQINSANEILRELVRILIPY